MRQPRAADPKCIAQYHKCLRRNFPASSIILPETATVTHLKTRSRRIIEKGKMLSGAGKTITCPPREPQDAVPAHEQHGFHRNAKHLHSQPSAQT